MLASCFLVYCVATMLQAPSGAAQEAAGAAGAATTEKFSLDQSNRESRSCTLQSGREGICVKFAVCHDNYTINHFGVIDDNEIRLGGCPGRHDWCCEHDAKPLPPAVRRSSGVAPSCGPCVTGTAKATSPECPLATGCPWCVTLHRSGGSPRTRAADGRHCGGVLVAGGGAALTAASCVLAATRQAAWAQRGARNYTKHTAVPHPGFNSGTRENDLALMVLSGEAGAAACLPPPAAPPAPPPGSPCLAVGYEKDGTLVMTEVEVTEGLCGARGGAGGALCARPRGAGAGGAGGCRVSLGAPLLCAGEGGGGGWAVWGVSRGGGCGAEGASYSAVSTGRGWLQQLLPEPPGAVSSITETAPGV